MTGTNPIHTPNDNDKKNRTEPIIPGIPSPEARAATPTVGTLHRTKDGGAEWWHRDPKASPDPADAEDAAPETTAAPRRWDAARLLRGANVAALAVLRDHDRHFDALDRDATRDAVVSGRLADTFLVLSYLAGAVADGGEPDALDLASLTPPTRDLRGVTVRTPTGHVDA